VQSHVSARQRQLIREIKMQAKDIMTTSVATVGPDASITEIAELLLSRQVSAVPVVDAGGRPVGIVSENDLMRRADSDRVRRPSWWLALVGGADDNAREYVRTHGGTAADVMTRPVISIGEDVPVNEVAHLLESEHIKRLPVLRDGKIVGIVSRADLLRALASGEAPRRAALDGDRELRERVEAEIAAAHVPADFVSVSVADGEVHLWGAAESRQIKQAIRTAAEVAAGAGKVHDNVRTLSSSLRAWLWV
jgi:CBS domain-containing protein